MVSRLLENAFSRSIRVIGGGSYWAERAAAHPLFRSCGPPLSLDRPILSTDLNITYAVLRSHYNVLTSTDIETGTVRAFAVGR